MENLEERRLLSAVPLGSSMPLGATPQDTGEFLLGRVAVTPVLIESNGQLDPSTENWTSEEIEGVLTDLAAGTQWWVDTLATLTDRHALEFVIDDTFARDPQPSPYEPIARPSKDYVGYVGQFLSDQGYGEGGSLADAMLAFNHAQREALDTDWAFTIFIVDSSNDEDGQFSPDPQGGGFLQAFAFAGGLFFITPSGRPASTYAHELGHIFWAKDEYEDFGSEEWWKAHRGYYNTQNTNAADNPTPGFEHQPSIMSAGTVLRDAFETHQSPASTLAMVGWQDSDGDGVFDVLDVPLELTASAAYLEESGVLRVLGTASAVALPNANPSGLQNDITLNRISRLEYRVDGGNWLTAATPDAQQVALDLEIPLSPSFTTVELRVIDATTGITSETIVVPRGRPAGSATSLSGFLYVDRDGDSVWDADEELLPSTGVRLVDATVPHGRIEPDAYAGGTIPSDHPGVRIEAVGLNLGPNLSARPGHSASTAEFFYRDASFTWDNRWNSAQGRQFSATFDNPTSAAQITAIGGVSGAYARLSAYDAEGNLVARDTVGPLAVGQSAVLRVDDPSGAIHRIVAGGHSNTSVGLDDFRFGPSTVTTSDSLGRFSIAGLPDGTYTVGVEPSVAIYAVAGDSLEVTVVGGAAAPLAVPMVVVPSRWQNPDNRLDTNDDGLVSPLDALLVINDLNRVGGRVLGDSDPTSSFIDANGDGWLSPLDALHVINFLNRQASGGEGETAAAYAPPLSQFASAAPISSLTRDQPLDRGTVSPRAADEIFAGEDFFAGNDFKFEGTFEAAAALKPISEEFAPEARQKLDNLQTLGKLGPTEGVEVQPSGNTVLA